MIKSIFATMFLFSAVTTLPAGDFYYIAHRGEYMTLPAEPASGVRKGVVDAPEGTRPAFERVRDKGINAVKLDVQYTADKVVVISHDTNLKRTTGQDLPIATTRYEDLKNVPFHQFGSFNDERIATLEEVLPLVKGCQVIYLDFKAYTPEMMQDVFKIFAAHEIPREKIMIATFNKDALKGAMLSHPDVRRVLHVSFNRSHDSETIKTRLRVLKEEMGLYGFNIPTRSPLTTPDLVRELKAEGDWVTLWFGHSTDVADQFYNSNVDGFVTGMPSAFRAYLEEKSKK